MMTPMFVLFTSLVLNLFGFTSTGDRPLKSVASGSFQSAPQTGIVYFSDDNGENWVNASAGLPPKVRIGLGGIATSGKSLGIATKEAGVYLYNFHTKMWENIPTDKQVIEGNIGTIAIMEDVIFVGTQTKGIFYTRDFGKSWSSLNTGLTHLTIRRFCEFNQVLYVCTNDGFYSLRHNPEKWTLEYGQPSLQTNGAALYKGHFYLATNKGIFSQNQNKAWVHSSPDFSMHNISASANQLYTMTYNKLLLSSPDGKTWYPKQNGLPKDLYTFNVLNHNNLDFAGQWDGIYTRTSSGLAWEPSGKGLPPKFAVTNLKAFHQTLVISSSE